MKRSAAWFGILAAVGMLTGCVERRYVITSDPPTAIVLENGKPVGATPVDGSFVYYGTYDFTLIRDGYETLHVHQPIKTPWYEIPPLDFLTENLIPYRFKDVRTFHYQMQPLQAVRSDQVLNRAEQLRERAAAVSAQSANGRQVPQPPPSPQLLPPTEPTAPAEMPAAPR
jgi:hypothetical protein